MIRDGTNIWLFSGIQTAFTTLPRDENESQHLHDENDDIA